MTGWGGRQEGKEDGGRRKEERDGMEVGFWRLILGGRAEKEGEMGNQVMRTRDPSAPAVCAG